MSKENSTNFNPEELWKRPSPNGSDLVTTTRSEYLVGILSGVVVNNIGTRTTTYHRPVCIIDNPHRRLTIIYFRDEQGIITHSSYRTAKIELKTVIKSSPD